MSIHMMMPAESISKYFASEEARLTQRFLHNTVRKLPLSFRDITPHRALPKQGGTITAKENIPSVDGTGDSHHRFQNKAGGRESISAKYGKLVAKGQAFIPVPFTATFTSRVMCVEVSTCAAGYGQ